MIPSRIVPLGTEPYKRRLQYLDSTIPGTTALSRPWIDTGYVPSRDGFRVVLDGYMSASGAGDKYWFGIRLLRSGSGREGINCASNLSTVFSYTGGGSIGISREYLTDPVSVSMTYTKTGDNKYTVTMEAGGQTKSRTTLTLDDFIASGITIPLFRLRQYNAETGEEGTPSINGVRICRFRICDVNGSLIRDLIPVLDHNGEACMFDTVMRRFYYRQSGTNPFLYE